MKPQPTECIQEVPPTTLAEALRVVRRRHQWSIEQAAHQLQMSSRHLDQLETGIRTPDDELLATIARTYGIELARLPKRELSVRKESRFDVETSTLWLGTIPVDVGDGSPTDLLAALGDTMRTLRGLDEEAPVYIRTADYRVLASLLDLEDAELVVQIMKILRLTYIESVDLVAKISDARITARPDEAEWTVRPVHELAEPAPAA